MFDSGVPHDQFHQFIASRNPISLPLAFPLHGVPSSEAAAAAPPPPPSFPGCFDLYSQTLQPLLRPTHHQHSGLLQLHQQRMQQDSTRSMINDDEEKEETSSQLLSSTNLRHAQRERSISNHHPIDDSWSNDEVLALLRIRSSFENPFPDFTWEHVSRKLSELGFKRSAEKCKEKFEEESGQFDNMNYSKTYRFFSELDELYQGENPMVVQAEKIQNLEEKNDKEDEEGEMEDPNPVEDAENNIIAVRNHPSEEINEELVMKPITKSKKRKRKDKFEMFKGFCEALVKKIIAQQEELNNKIIKDIMKREEEHTAREEAWRRQEIERISKENEIRARERAVAGDKQAKIIEFLKKFVSDSSDDQGLKRRIDDFLKVTNSSTSATSSSEFSPHNYINTPSQQQSSDQSKLEAATSSNMIISTCQNPTTFLLSQNYINLPTSSSETPSIQNHSSTPKPTSTSMAWENPNDASRQVQANPLASSPQSSVLKLNQQTNSATNERWDRDVRNRWPRDEVLALINLRCSLNNNNNYNNEDNKEAAKGPLWERISRGMLELGYKRSAKRCKEKWENINKYFRKTKDNKKKRSRDSRTCPYFHQLSSLYSQGTQDAVTSDELRNGQTSPENS